MQIIGARRKFLRETRCQLDSKMKTKAFYEAASQFEIVRGAHSTFPRETRLPMMPIASGGGKFQVSGRA